MYVQYQTNELVGCEFESDVCHEFKFTYFVLSLSCSSVEETMRLTDPTSEDYIECQQVLFSQINSKEVRLKVLEVRCLAQFVISAKIYMGDVSLLHTANNLIDLICKKDCGRLRFDAL